MQEPQTQEPYAGSIEYAPEHGTDRALQYQLNSDEVIEEVAHTLKAEIPTTDEETGETKWIKDPAGGQPLINQKGANRVLLLLRSRLSKVYILSDLEDHDIRQMTLGMAHDLIDELYLHWDTYEVAGTSAAAIIVNTVVDATYSTLRRAYLGKTLNFLKTTQRIQSVQTYDDRQPGPGEAGVQKKSFFPWRNG